MAEFTCSELRKARESKKIQRWKVAQVCGVSEDTVCAWEVGERIPHPDDIDRFGEAIDNHTIWHKWMLSNVESYRKRYIGGESHELPLAILKTRHEMNDVFKLQDGVERDALDGHIGDQ